MNNDFWIFCKTKTCRSLIIDVYDPAYMERPRELDERFDNTYLPHYRLARKKGKSQRENPVEGEQYLKSDGEVYTVVYDTECRVCELVWEAWKGEIPEGFRISHIDGNKQNNRLDNLELVKLQ